MRPAMAALFAFAAALGCEPHSPAAEREEPTTVTATIDAALIAALEYVADLERSTIVYQGSRPFRLSESVSVVFSRAQPQRSDGRRLPPGVTLPQGPRWSTAVEDSIRARGWDVMRPEEAKSCGYQEDFDGSRVCRLSGDPNGLLLEVGLLAFAPYPDWPGMPEPPGIGGLKVTIGSFRNRVVAFDIDLYEKAYEEVRAGLREPWTMLTAAERDVTEAEIMATYDRMASASSAPGVLGGVSYFVRIVPGGDITHSVATKPLLSFHH